MHRRGRAQALGVDGLDDEGALFRKKIDDFPLSELVPVLVDDQLHGGVGASVWVSTRPSNGGIVQLHDAADG